MVRLGCLFITFVLSSPAIGQTATQVMRKSKNIDQGKSSVATTTMALIDTDGSTELRQLKVYKKNQKSVTKSVSFFLKPSDLRNTSYLVYDWEKAGKDDDSWLYLPALRKTKRIVGSSQSDSFMGSDYSYADINGLEFENWTYSFVKKSEFVNGKECWVIQSLPKRSKKRDVISKTGYVKTQVWIRKDNYVPIKGKYWLKSGNKVKYMSASDIKKVNGIWTAFQTQMVTTQNGKKIHSTVNKIKSIKYNVPLKSNMFLPQKLESGI